MPPLPGSWARAPQADSARPRPAFLPAGTAWPGCLSGTSLRTSQMLMSTICCWRTSSSGPTMRSRWPPTTAPGGVSTAAKSPSGPCREVGGDCDHGGQALLSPWACTCRSCTCPVLPRPRHLFYPVLSCCTLLQLLHRVGRGGPEGKRSSGEREEGRGFRVTGTFYAVRVNRIVKPLMLSTVHKKLPLFSHPSPLFIGTL